MDSSMHEDPADPDDAAATGPDPMQVGIEQFQRAALEAIRAGRAMLDAAESVLQDPKAAESVIRSVGSVARTASEAVSGFTAGRWSTGQPAADQADEGGGDDPEPPDGFERITID
jgi:hypothetical protein